MDILPQEEGALIALHEATAGGLRLGSRLTVPPGFAGVVVKDGKPLDTLPAGDHVLEPSLLPGLAQKVKPRFGPGQAPDSAAPLPAAVFLVPIGLPAALPWRAQAVLSKNAAYGLTYTTLEGRCTVQIADPAHFCAAVFQAGSKALSTGQASPNQVAREFLLRGVPARVAEAVGAMNMPPDQAAQAREALRASAGQAVALWLSGVGVQCTAFDLDAVAAPDRAPCACCGSRVAPTGYGHFRRTISLLYVRFTAQKEGNFCVPCAWKFSAGYNSVMLVAGWWGIIGLILTPVYFAQNVYHLTRIVTGPKSAPHQEQPVVSSEGVWPPPPMAS